MQQVATRSMDMVGDFHPCASGPASHSEMLEDPASYGADSAGYDEDATREAENQVRPRPADVPRMPTFTSMPSAYSTLTTLTDLLPPLLPPGCSRRPTFMSKPSEYSTSDTLQEDGPTEKTSSFPEASSLTLDSIESALASTPAFPSPPSTLPSPSITSSRRTASPSPVAHRYSPYSQHSAHTYPAGSSASTPRGSLSNHTEQPHGILRSRVSMDAILPGRQGSAEPRRHSGSTKDSYQGSPRLPFGTPQLDSCSYAGPSRPQTPSVLDIHQPACVSYDRFAHADEDDIDVRGLDSPMQNVTWDDTVVDGIVRSAPGVYGLGEGWAGGPQIKPRRRWFQRKRRVMSVPNTEDPLALWEDPAQSPQSQPARSTVIRSVWNRSKAAFASMPSLIPPSPTSASTKSQRKPSKLSRMAAWSKSRLALSKVIPEEEGSEGYILRRQSMTATGHYRRASEVIVASPTPVAPSPVPVTPPSARRNKWILPISPSEPNLGVTRKAKDVSVVARRLDHMPGPVPARQGSLVTGQLVSPVFSSPRTPSPIMLNSMANASAPALSFAQTWKPTAVAPALSMPQVPEVDEPQYSFPDDGASRILDQASITFRKPASLRSETFGMGSSTDFRPDLPRSGTFGLRATPTPPISRSTSDWARSQAVGVLEELVDSTQTRRSAEGLRNSVIGLDTLAVWANEAADGSNPPGARKRSSIKVVKSALSSLKQFSWSRSTLSLSGSSENHRSSNVASTLNTPTPPQSSPAMDSYDSHSSRGMPDALPIPSASLPVGPSRRSASRMFKNPQANASLAWLKRLSKLTEEDEGSRRVSQVMPDNTWRCARHQSTSNLPLGDPFQRIYGSGTSNAFKSTSALNELDLDAGSFDIDDILDNRRRREIVKRISMTDLSTTANSPTLNKRFSQSEYNIPQSIPLHTRIPSHTNSIANSTTSASSGPLPSTPPRAGRTIYIDGGASGSSSEIIPKSLPYPPRPLSGVLQKRNAIQNMASAQSSTLSVVSGLEIYRDAQESLLDSSSRRSMDDSIFEDALEDTIPSHAQKGNIATMQKTASLVSLNAVL